MLDLSAGINGKVSGRENILFRSKLLGRPKQLALQTVEDACEFGDLAEFIDQPVETYSSGMQVRLGFAIATALHPDILILDEVLAVGDASFRNKCYKRIAELRKSAAIIFVTHQMSHIARMCDSTLVLKQGRAIFLGNVEEGVSQYEVLNENLKIEDSSFLSLSQPIESFLFGLSSDIINQGDAPRLNIEISSEAPIENFIFRFLLYNQLGDICAGSDTSSNEHNILITKGTNHWTIELPCLFLKRGKYSVAINVMTHAGELLVWSFKQRQIEIKSEHHGPSVDYQPQLKNWASHQHNNRESTSSNHNKSSH
jgi:lipopolysaccharide transport system ATP-binding protein